MALPEKRPINSPTAELLKSLQATGKYLFHGSDTVLDILTPARARSHGKTDSEAKVFATEWPAIAVFHALARTAKRSDPNQRRTKHGFSVDAGTITLRAQPKLLHAIERSRQSTNIYLLDKAGFRRRGEMEWRALKRVSPIAVIFARSKDLAGLIDRHVKLELLEGP